MPTYEYGCSACGKQWEVEQRITEDPIKRCPGCDKDTARRLISGGNFMLKGGGWYADGYASTSGSKPSGSSESSSSDSKPSSSESKSGGD